MLGPLATLSLRVTKRRPANAWFVLRRRNFAASNLLIKSLDGH